MGNGTVVILCPMDCECELLTGRLEDRRETRIGGYSFSEGRLEERPVVVIRCLMGTVNAAVCTALAIERYRPACVLLQGTAGAHDPELNRGDIVIAEKIVSLTNVVSPRLRRGEGSDPFKWEEFGVQSYSARDDSLGFANAFFCDPRLVALAASVPYREGRVLTGTVGCGDVWNREADLILFYHRTKGTACEAMEGVGAAQVCAAFDVPMLELRVVSNCELHENERFSVASAQCVQRFVLGLLRKMRDADFL